MLWGIVIFLLVFSGCAYQAQPVIGEGANPQVVIREAAPTRSGPVQGEEFFETPYMSQDMTRGVIENQAFPYVPKVWLALGRGERMLLLGPEQGPPEMNSGEMREFNLPPGRHILHVERWQFLPYYGGWQKLPQVEVVRLSVAEFSRQRHRQYWIDEHYGWRVLIYPDRTQVHAGYID